MSRIRTQGPLAFVAGSWARLIGWSLATMALRVRRGPLAPGWPLDFEIGVRFWRGQWKRAFAMRDIARARLCFDSLITWTDEVYEVDRLAAEGGVWITPRGPLRAATLLYFHGGGYAFHSAITDAFADMLASHLRARTFALHYRLTPEHPHPAQRDDALAAYRRALAQGISPDRIVLIGDSAGGHLALMTLAALRENGLPPPALVVGLCPWTDIGERGESFHGNDRYDLVQGYMAAEFGRWLVGDTGATREAVSPIYQNYRGLAPIYLQGGGRECLIDGIRDFAAELERQGCEALLDVWPRMTHDFQAHGKTRPESAEALARIDAAIAAYAENGPPFAPCAETERCALTRAP